MPEMEGIEFIATFRKKFSKVNILAMSGANPPDFGGLIF
jgi:CheY-like chemotaxis protein